MTLLTRTLASAALVAVAALAVPAVAAAGPAYPNSGGNCGIPNRTIFATTYALGPFAGTVTEYTFAGVPANGVWVRFTTPLTRNPVTVQIPSHGRVVTGPGPVTSALWGTMTGSGFLPGWRCTITPGIAFS